MGRGLAALLGDVAEPEVIAERGGVRHVPVEFLKPNPRNPRRAFAEADLSAPVPVPQDVPWFPKDVEHWSPRWVALHLVEELSRHAGHADIIRESIDRATMYELMAAAEEWPETQWIKRWRPAGAQV